MLKEKVTVTICGKPYNLRTNDAAALRRQAEESDRRITEYCKLMPNNPAPKEDACVFTVLDLLGELDTASAERDALAKRNSEMTAAAEKGARATEENQRLTAEIKELRKDSVALEALQKSFTELEGKNAQLAVPSGSEQSAPMKTAMRNPTWTPQTRR